MKRFLAVVVFSCIGFAMATTAFAHAFVDHATPRVGSTVSDSPGEVQIEFTEELDPGQSAIAVYDAEGKEVDKKDSHVDAKDKALLIVSLPVLAPGVYKVVWHVVAVDTHKTHSDFQFTYKPKG